MSQRDMTIVSNDAEPTPEAIDTELWSIERLMRDPQSDYWRGLLADRYQRRYRELVDLKENQQER